MPWRVEFETDAEKELQRLATAEDPRRFGSSLRGGMHGYWRYRVADYRIIAKVEEHRLLVLVVRVGHRKDVYDF